jgi:hypothetical protein
MRILALLILTTLCAQAQLNVSNARFVAGLLKPAAAGGGSPTFPAGAVAYWKLDEVSGSAVDFYTGNDLAETGVVDRPAGKINNGAELIPTGFETFSSADTADLSMGSNVDFSLSAWIKVDDLSTGRTFLSKNSSGHGYELTVTSGGKLRFQVWTGGPSDFDSSATLVVSTWYHVVATYDQSNIRLYIDGSLDSTQSNTTDVPDEANTFRIGYSEAAGSLAFDGLVDEIGIWKRALSGAEVTDLYNGGTGLQP